MASAEKLARHPATQLFVAFGVPQNQANDERLEAYCRLLDAELPAEVQRAAVVEVLRTWRYSGFPPVGEVVQRGKALLQARRAQETPPPPRKEARDSQRATEVVQKVLAEAEANPVRPSTARQFLAELHERSRKQYARDRLVCVHAGQDKPLSDTDVRRVLMRGDYELGGLAWWLRRELERRGDPRAEWARRSKRRRTR